MSSKGLPRLFSVADLEVSKCGVENEGEWTLVVGCRVSDGDRAPDPSVPEDKLSSASTPLGS